MVELKEKIESLRKIIEEYRSFYEQNEMAVRDQIINPILKCLGWDNENPAEIQPNVTSEEGVPDYSLLQDGKKVLFIEAKKLSIDLENKAVLNQLAKYCFGEGMRYGVLTNGVMWILFRSFQEGTTMEERIVWRVDIENDDSTSIIRRLNTIEKRNISDIEDFIKKLPILDETWKSLLLKPENLFYGFFPVFANLIEEKHPECHFEETEIEDFLKQQIKELFIPKDNIIPKDNVIPKDKIRIDHTKNIAQTKNIYWNRLFMNPEKHEKELVNRNILVKKGLWLAFIERKEMSSKEFKKLYDFKPKAVAGFLKFLVENHLATKTGYT